MPVYLKNADLLVEVKRARELDYITPELANMFVLMANQYIKHPWWNGHTKAYKEDMIGEALYALTKAAFKFNPETSNNAFAYYTTTMRHAFAQVKKYEKKHRNIRDSLLVSHGMDPSFGYTEEQKKEEIRLKELAEEIAKNAVDPIDDSTANLDNLFTFSK